MDAKVGHLVLAWRIELVFKMCVYRRMLRIPLINKVNNVGSTSQNGKEVELLVIIKKRKLQYIGHIIREEKYEIVRLILEGKIDGKRSLRRR